MKDCQQRVVLTVAKTFFVNDLTPTLVSLMLLKFNLKASGQRLLKVLDELAPLSSWLRELETHFSARANVKIRRLFSVSQNQGSPCLINFHLLGQRLRQSHWILGRLQLQIASDMYLFEICASSSD